MKQNVEKVAEPNSRLAQISTIIPKISQDMGLRCAPASHCGIKYIIIDFAILQDASNRLCCGDNSQKR